MSIRLVSALLAAALAVAAAPKTPPQARASDPAVDLSATLFLGKEAVKQVLGSDLDGYYVVLEVRLAPKGKALTVSRDDFLLRTDKDGEKSKPFAPSQIAGRGVLVVTQGASSGGIMAEDQGPVWGGYPGGPMGRLPGQGGTIGTGGMGGSAAEATMDSGTRKKENPLMRVLSEKILPEKEIDQPVSGLLYFPLDGKQKAKDLELIYTSPAGKISLRFR